MKKRKYFLVLLLSVVIVTGCSEEEQGGIFEITDISPLSGSCGDVITIRGNQFGSSKQGIQVLLSGNEAQIVRITNQEITIRITTEDTSGAIEIRKGQEAVTSDQLFEVREQAPVILQSISSEEGFFQDEITISGENFHPTQTSVSLDNTNFEIVSITSSEIKVKIPFVLNKKGNIRVTSGCQEVNSNFEFWINTSQGSWNQFWNDRWHDGHAVESENFIVYSEKSSTEMRRQIASEAETSLIDLKSIINYQEGDFQFRTDYESEKIHILADYNQQAWVGLAYRDGFIIRARDSPRYNGDADRWQKVFQHEMAHVLEFLMIGEFQHRQANTVWMREGFGNYGARNHAVQTVAQLNSWKNKTKDLPGAGNPIAVRVWGDFPQSVIDNNTFVEYYAFFELAVRYLLDPNGQNKTISDLKAYYDDLGKGLPNDVTFEKHFGITMDEFETNYWDLMTKYLE